MDQQPNVYQMYVAHGGAGFWVRRTTWDRTCARVVAVGKFTKSGPYFGDPPVLVDVYSLDGRLKDGLALMSVPGTYKTWRKMDAPDWAAVVDLRSLDDPAIPDVLNANDRRRTKETQSSGGRITLKVTFAEKDKAKAIGARWDPAKRIWWIPAGKSALAEKARELGFL